MANLKTTGLYGTEIASLGLTLAVLAWQTGQIKKGPHCLVWLARLQLRSGLCVPVEFQNTPPLLMDVVPRY